MRAFGWMAIAVVTACGGGGTTEDTDGNTTRPTGNNDQGICDGLPEFDIEGMNCDQLTSAFTQVVDAYYECETKNDCQAVRVQCEHWGALGCYYPVNTCFQDMAAFNAEAGPCAETGGQAGICKCGGAPDVDCVNGQCVFDYNF